MSSQAKRDQTNLSLQGFTTDISARSACGTRENSPRGPPGGRGLQAQEEGPRVEGPAGAGRIEAGSHSRSLRTLRGRISPR